MRTSRELLELFSTIAFLAHFQKQATEEMLEGLKSENLEQSPLYKRAQQIDQIADVLLSYIKQRTEKDETTLVADFLPQSLDQINMQFSEIRLKVVDEIVKKHPEFEEMVTAMNKLQELTDSAKKESIRSSYFSEVPIFVNEKAMGILFNKQSRDANNLKYVTQSLQDLYNDIKEDIQEQQKSGMLKGKGLFERKKSQKHIIPETTAKTEEGKKSRS